MSLTATAPKRTRGRRSKPPRIDARLLAPLLLSAAGIGWPQPCCRPKYTFTLQSPLRSIRFQWSQVIAARISLEEAGAAQAEGSWYQAHK